MPNPPGALCFHATFSFRPAERWSSVQRTVGIVQLLMTGDRPATINDAVVTDLRTREIDGLVQLPTRPEFEPGDRVRVLRGPLRDQVGIFADMLPRERIVVLLQLLGTEHSIALPRGAVMRMPSGQPNGRE